MARWQRRRDLEGGKELGVWLLREDGAVTEELYVESHEYRGGNFDVYTYTDAEDWVHRGERPTAVEAFDVARDYLADSGHPVDGE